jgi:hypothetical protein
MKRCLAISALAAAFTIASLPALADPTSDALKAKIGAAWQGVKSFKMSASATAGKDNPLAGGSMTTTMVLPDKMEIATDTGRFSVKMVVLSGETWMSMNGYGWRKIPSREMGAPFKPSDPKTYTDQSIVNLLPDEDFNGKRVGTFTGSSATGKEGLESVCNYDKATYLLVRCHNAKAVVLFTDYNSPTNVIDVPN